MRELGAGAMPVAYNLVSDPQLSKQQKGGEGGKIDNVWMFLMKKSATKKRKRFLMARSDQQMRVEGSFLLRFFHHGQLHIVRGLTRKRLLRDGNGILKIWRSSNKPY